MSSSATASSSTGPLGPDIALAGVLVHEAGVLAARMLVAGLETFHKTSISDVVSDADRAAEALITRRLTLERPADGLVGEEGTRRAGERTWFVDPVDGTYNFLSMLPSWCSAVALTQGLGSASVVGDLWPESTLAGPAASAAAEPLLGAVYQPAVDELWQGGVGHPTTLNGRPVSALVDQPLAELSVATYLHPSRMEEDRLQPVLAVLARAATVRMLGSGSIELANVAGGRLGAFLQANCLPWDWLPGAALVRAAGGDATVIEHRGQRWCLAGNRRAVREMTSAIVAD